MSGLPAVSGTIIVKADGLAPEARPIELQPLPLTNAERFRLRQAGVIEGQIVDRSGAPVSGAVVTVDYPGGRYFGRYLATLVGGKTRTGTDGAFRLNEIVPDIPIQVIAEAGNRKSVPLQIRVAEGQRLAPVIVTLPDGR